MNSSCSLRLECVYVTQWARQRKEARCVSTLFPSHTGTAVEMAGEEGPEGACRSLAVRGMVCCASPRRSFYTEVWLGTK